VWALSGLGAWLAVLATRPAAVCLPVGYATLRGAAHDICDRNLGLILTSEYRLHDTQTWQTLCRIIGEHLAIDPATLTEDTEFLRDLGC
jgi:hypothetical protein